MCFERFFNQLLEKKLQIRYFTIVEQLHTRELEM